LGIALAGQRKLPEAIDRFRKALEIDPEYTHARIILGNVLRHQGKLDEAIDEYREAVRRKPNHAQARNQLASALEFRAWTLATDPDSKKRDPGRAVELAKEAVKLAPRSVSAWNALGVAHYRAGRWEESVAALQKGGDSFGWFFLAMAHWQLGNKPEARKWYDRAVARMEQNQPPNRAEAAQLLGVEKKKD